MATPDFKTLLHADIHSAPRDNGKISVLCTRPGFGARVYPQSLQFCPETGVEQDRWRTDGWLKSPDGTPDPQIQVAVIGKRLLDCVWGGPDDDAPYPGDTMVVDMDFDSAHLPAGTRLRAGSVLLEVSETYNDGCTKWKVRYGEDAFKFVRAPETMSRRPRGMFCRILTKGTVSIGDRLSRAD
ncbi:MOSC domain-containing protein [Halocynthiibacter namhaensis]|uniref:MOSC domain-containing protein n=1 Tax=Halocynthiibacter namhaensis TaxID=1290553 RepID=UPI0005792E00|nr:hypothetical protein [Halocynthiibacter namhaensis]